jgi:aminoglycoside phosphotransferase (APT) family kinase protein
MTPGAALEAHWSRLEPRRTLSAPVLQRIVDTAFPRRRVVEIQPLTEGLRNANFKLRLDSTPESIVLRIYEHDASLCQKEVDLLRLVGGSVPVPEVLYAEPRGCPDLPPFMLTRYVEGISFRDLKRSGDTDAIAEAAYSAGETLAAISRVAFPQGGMARSGTGGHGAHYSKVKIPRRALSMAASSRRTCERRMPADLRDRTQCFDVGVGSPTGRSQWPGASRPRGLQQAQPAGTTHRGTVVRGRCSRLGIRRFRLSAGRP